MAVELREITKDTLRAILKVKVASNQEHLVANNAASIAEASFHDEAWFRGIYADGEPVGFAMLHLDPDKAEYWVWRFMVGAEHQRRGYGRAAMALVIDKVRAMPNAQALLLCHMPIEGNAGPFYEKLGFVYTGEKEGEELVMKLAL